MTHVLGYILVLTAVLQLAGAGEESTAGPGTAGGTTVQPTSAETSARAALMGESEGTTNGVVTVVPTTEAGTSVQPTLSGTSTYTTLQPDVGSTEREPEGTTNGITTVVPTTESSVVVTSVHTDFAETTAHTTPRPGGVSTEDELEGTTNGVVTVVPTTEDTVGLDRELGTTDGITTEVSPDVVVVATEYSELSTSEPDVITTAVSIKYAEASAATTEVGSAARSTYLATSGPTTPQPQTWVTTSFSPATNGPETPSTPTTPTTGTTEKPCTYWVLCQPRRPVESLTTRATTTTNSTTHATTTTNSTTHATRTTNSTTLATTTTNSTKGTPSATGTPANAGNGCAFWFFCGDASVEPTPTADSSGDLSHPVTSSRPENIFTQPSQRTAVETTREDSTRPAEACALWWEWQCAVEHSTLPTTTTQHLQTHTAATHSPTDPTTTLAATGRRPCNFWLGLCGPDNRVPQAGATVGPDNRVPEGEAVGSRLDISVETQTLLRCWYCLFSQHGNR
ncbi:uncharacterized protein LOC144885603 [Branchiostoma floridae x Branchiostoma japonicum]